MFQQLLDLSVLWHFEIFTHHVVITGKFHVSMTYVITGKSLEGGKENINNTSHFANPVAKPLISVKLLLNEHLWRDLPVWTAFQAWLHLLPAAGSLCLVGNLYVFKTWKDFSFICEAILMLDRWRFCNWKLRGNQLGVKTWCCQICLRRLMKLPTSICESAGGCFTTGSSQHDWQITDLGKISVFSF